MEKKSLREKLEELADDFRIRLLRGSRTDKTEATGEYARGWDVEATDSGFTVTNMAEYAKAVLEGASPAKTREDWEGKNKRIERWVRAKGIRPYRKLKNGFKFAKTSTGRNSAYKSMLFMIQKTISDKGTIKRFQYKGSNLLDEVYRDMEKKIGVELTEAYRKDLKMEIKRIINIDTNAITTR